MDAALASFFLPTSLSATIQCNTVLNCALFSAVRGGCCKAWRQQVSRLFCAELLLAAVDKWLAPSRRRRRQRFQLCTRVKQRKLVHESVLTDHECDAHPKTQTKGRTTPQRKRAVAAEARTRRAGPDARRRADACRRRMRGPHTKKPRQVVLDQEALVHQRPLRQIRLPQDLLTILTKWCMRNVHNIESQVLRNQMSATANVRISCINNS